MNILSPVIEKSAALIPIHLTVYHPVGTCKMGQDKMSVVDEALRVKGLHLLWVFSCYHAEALHL